MYTVSRWALPLLFAVTLTGCSMVGKVVVSEVSKDIAASWKIADQARKLGIIAPDDPLVRCLQLIDADLRAMDQLLDLSSNRPLASSTMAYVINQRTESGALMEQACGPVTLRLLRNAARRLPGL